MSDALQRYVQTLEAEKNQGRHIVTVALDLSNAFNSAWMPYISRQLKKAEVEQKLGNICLDFLEDRTISSGRAERRMDKGYPQGSSLGPTM